MLLAAFLVCLAAPPVDLVDPWATARRDPRAQAPAGDLVDPWQRRAAPTPPTASGLVDPWARRRGAPSPRSTVPPRSAGDELRDPFTARPRAP